MSTSTTSTTPSSTHTTTTMHTSPSPVSGSPAGSPPAGDGPGPVRRKPSRRANTAERRATHNAVERQRREPLNGRFLDLAALLPNLASVRRPSKSAIVNSSIALIMAQRRARAVAGRELRNLKLETDALRREVNEWRARTNMHPIDEVPRTAEFFDLLQAEEVSDVTEDERRAYEMRDRAAEMAGDDEDGGDELDDPAALLAYAPQPQPQFVAPQPQPQPQQVRVHTANLAFEPVFDVMQQSPAVHYAPQWAQQQQQQFAPQPQQLQHSQDYLVARQHPQHVQMAYPSPPFHTSDDDASSVGSAPSPRGMVSGVAPTGFELATGAAPAEFARFHPQQQFTAAPGYQVAPKQVAVGYGLIM